MNLAQSVRFINKHNIRTCHGHAHTITVPLIAKRVRNLTRCKKQLFVLYVLKLNRINNFFN